MIVAIATYRPCGGWAIPIPESQAQGFRLLRKTRLPPRPVRNGPHSSRGFPCLVLVVPVCFVVRGLARRVAGGGLGGRARLGKRLVDQPRDLDALLDTLVEEETDRRGESCLEPAAELRLHVAR